jgi:hypothetical protein
MTISRMGISSLMGYQDGGDVDLLKSARKRAEANYDNSFDKYQQRLSAIQSKRSPVSFYEAAGKIGAGLLAQQAEKFPSIGRGLGIGFQSLSEEIAKRREEKRKEEQAIAMKAMELSLQDEQQGQKFLNDYALKMIDMQNKDIKTITFDTSMLVDALDENGEAVINPKTGVPFTSKTTVRANDSFINDLLTLGATEIDRAATNINLGAGGNELDKKRAGKIADAEAKWQEESDAATALRDQVMIARSLANELGPDGFGPVDSLTMGLRGLMIDLGMGNLVDSDKLATQQALTQTSIGFVMALVGKTKGAISNKEMEIFFQASPTLGSTYDGYMRMLGYMDRIAELSERYNTEWQAKSVELQGKSISEINAEFAKFKTEFKAKPENKLIQTDEELKELKDIADKKTYNEVNKNYLTIQKEAQKNDEDDSIAKLKSDIIAEMVKPETTAERKAELQSLLDQIGG